MADKSFLLYVSLGLIFFASVLQPVAAFDGGDTAALIIGLIIGIMGICACVGAYARRQPGGI